VRAAIFFITVYKLGEFCYALLSRLAFGRLHASP
jgi:hypothetical protein